MAADHDRPNVKGTYRRPKLTIYGDLRDLTRTSAAAGSMNDMTTGMNKSA